MKTKSNSILIVVAIIALCFIGGYVYLTKYIASLSSKTAELKQYVSDKEIVYTKAQSLQKVASDAVQQKAKISSYFVKKDGAVDFISEIEKTARVLNLEYTTQGIDEVDTDELHQQNRGFLRVSFFAKGSWSSCMRFLKAIETLPYGMVIDSAILSTSGGRDGFSNVSNSETVASSADGSATSTGGTLGVPVSSSKNVWSVNVSFSVLKEI